MNRKQLNEYIYLKREIARNRNRLEQLKARLQTSGIVGDTASQYSTGKASPILLQGISDADLTLPMKIIELQELIEDATKKAQTQTVEVERYIQSIPDAKVRSIFRSRFIDGKSWHEVGRENYISPDHARRLTRKHSG